MRRFGWVIDLDRCTGCSACRIACDTENQLPSTAAWRRVHTFNPDLYPDLGRHHLSLACNHCGEPACLTGCPARAYHRDASTGAVLLDPDRCMGCSYCSWVCPFGAPELDTTRGVMGKCTLCYPRLERGLKPACVVACPVAALTIEETQEARPDSGEPAAAGFPRVAVRASIRFKPRRHGLRPPRMTLEHQVRPRTRPPFTGDLARGLAGEWSLLLFTLVATLLVGWFTAGLLGAQPPQLLLFAAAGAAAMAASALHLNNPQNLFRAAANFGSSWVSREVVLFTAFFGLACLQLTSTPGTWHPLLGWATAAAGLASLASADMVYRVRGQQILAFPHSAMVSFTAVLVVGLLARIPVLVVAVGSLKVLLYLARKLPHLRQDAPAASWIIRVVAGFMVPACVWALSGDLISPIAVAGIAVGELLDRAELYGELRFLDPQLQIERDQVATQPMRYH